ncbi:MAG: sugar ABC transporter permease [Phycisphaeraceae bacterium]|nr:sugar ABC transporter permease [Phycisphaeraceae bacterium]
MRAPRPTARGERTEPVWTGLLWISPWLIGFVGLVIFPLALSLYYSLTDYSVLEPPVYLGADNYRHLLHDSLFWTALGNNALYAAVFIPLSTAIALAIASLLARPMRWVSFFRAAVFVPSLVPIVATAMIWLWLFNSEYGLVNQALRALRLPAPNWLKDPNWAMISIIIISLWQIGRSVVVYIAAMREVPRHLYEAAHIDGFGRWGRFWHVTLPMISPSILFNVVLGIIDAWQVFAIPYIMTEGGPGRATYFYTHYLYDNAFRFMNMGYASALAWVQLVLILALTGVAFLISRRLVHYSAA